MKLQIVWLASVCLLCSAGIVLAQDPPQPKDEARRGNRRPGEYNAPAAKGERHPDRLAVGAAAPPFTLADPTGKKETTLSSFEGKKPVVLIFASCT